MQNYRLLNLPTSPLTKAGFRAIAERATVHRGYSCLENLDEILNPALLDSLRSLGLKPYYLTSFGVENKNNADNNDRIIHSDITLCRNTGLWRSIPFGINWELTSGVTTFQWWNVASPAIFPPAKDVPRHLELLSGAHYHELFRAGVHDDAHLVEELQLTQPTMVRTNVPHSVTFDTNAKTRHCISLRFNTDDIATWDQALEMLGPLIV